jgi:ABC-type transport system involved in multi-copper enzyme maturation permease subunit
MSRVQISVAWVKQRLGWSNSAESWIERAVGAAIVLSAVALWYAGSRLNLWQNVFLWAFLGITGAMLLRRGWLKLFGPVLFYDMLCTARRSRFFVVRCLYSMLLLLVLFSVWSSVAPFNRNSPRDEAAQIAMHYFEWFTVVQLVAVVVLTPAYVAGAVAEEKERKTLEFLLATDLRNREIILSKFGSRLCNLTLFLLTGLPILSFLQFLGGVDPDLVLSSFAATALTAVGVASLGILNSVIYKKPRDAIGITYLIVIGYLAIATTLFGFKMASVWIMSEPIWFGAGAPTAGDAVEWFNAGNMLAVLIQVQMAGTRGAGGSLATVVPPLLKGYFIFHGLVCLVCLTWSVLRLRSVALKQSHGKTEKLRWHQRFRPPVGNLPVLWKELVVEGSLGMHWMAWLCVIALVLLTFGSGVWILVYFIWDVLVNPQGFHGDFFQAMNMWARLAGAGVATLSLLGVAVRASTSIRSEMDKDTFDALITTPLPGNAILLGKFVGSLFSVRIGWLWLGSILGLAVITGGVHILALPLFLGAWTVYAVGFSLIGLWFSMVCKSSMRATVYTVLTTIGVSVGHWMIWMCCVPVFIFMELNRHGSDFAEYLAMFQAGMTPPFVLGFLAYSPEDLAHNFRHEEFAKLLGFCLLGLFLWTMASLMLWFVLIGPRFRALTRRNQSSSEME